PRRAVVAPYLSFWSLLLSQLWTDLGPLGVAVALYGLLLVATAALSACHGPRAGVGGALFLLSDVLIATRLAGWEQLPHADLLIMAAYYLGQFMLATGGPDRRGR
ncbi:MAG TPA: lysoplasmalogenase family protein, partial [Actinopolymorphaceae bacterium]